MNSIWKKEKGCLLSPRTSGAYFTIFPSVKKKKKKNCSSNYKPKLWILALDFWRGDVSRAFADAWNNLQCFCSICSEDGWNKYFKLINVRPAVPSTWLALVNIDGRERQGCSAPLAVCTRFSLPHKQIWILDESREVLCTTQSGFHITNKTSPPPLLSLN